MAYGDTVTSTSGSPDGEVTYTYAPTSAQGQPFVAGYAAEMALYLDDQRRAEAAGVTGVDKIDYAAALRNYESRPDVELFLNRRAREYADTFEAQNFTRQQIQIATPQQSSTVGPTSVVEGDDFVDVAGGGDPDGTGPLTDSPDGKDDTVIAPSRT